MLHWIIRKILGRIAVIPVRRRLAAFELATHAPQQVQEDLLRRIIARQAGTDFGKDHHFNDDSHARRLPQKPARGRL